MLSDNGGTFSGPLSTYKLTPANPPTLNSPIVGAIGDPGSPNGWWEVAADGGVFAYTAPFFGSMGGELLNKPTVGMAATRTGGGYWLVASDGGIFSYDAPFYGSTGSIVLNQPIVGMETSPTGGGYRFVARDGGIFCFGNAFFAGSATTGYLQLSVAMTRTGVVPIPGVTPPVPVVAMSGFTAFK